MTRMLKKDIGPELTLRRFIISKIDSDTWRRGDLTGMKHPKITQKEISLIGKQRLLEEAGELEAQGLIQVDWRDFRTDVKMIHFSVDIMDVLCQQEGIENPQLRLKRMEEELLYWKGKNKRYWMEPYYNKLLHRVRCGELIKEAEEPGFLGCLHAVTHVQELVWKRVLSAAVLNNSKAFERQYEKRVITILRKFSPFVQEDMSKEEVLREHGILSYTQQLEFKGVLTYRLNVEDTVNSIANKYIVNTEKNQYGTILNAQTLANAKIVDIRGIRRIIVIENKANYENMKFRKDTLYIYCHGFFSPKERYFLKQLAVLGGEASDEVEFWHWGDLDYGGIQIYQFIKQELFTNLRPYCMDRQTYEQALRYGAGYPIEQEKSDKLKQLKVADLAELKECILEYQMEVEQEMVLAFQMQEINGGGSND